MRITLAQWRAFCARSHGDQLYDEDRDLSYPYHLNKVEEVAVRFGFRSRTIRMICQGHDVIEDPKLTPRELLLAGASRVVVNAIMALSDEPGASRAERKAKTYPKIAKNRRALIVKLCDRIANVEFGIATGNIAKFTMYKSEFPEFQRQLRNRNDAALEPMWKHLEYLFQNGLELMRSAA
jgi:(p)ppGpp synthase/HD superfamily hydrolase